MIKFFNKSRAGQSGQSLVEVTIAAAALATGLVAVIASLIVSLRNNSVSSTQTLATQQNQEAIESFRQFQKELGWETFYQILNSKGNNYTVCLQNLPEDSADFNGLSTGACSVSGGFTGLVREAQIVVVGGANQEIQMTATTTWNDGATTREARAIHTFRDY